MFRNEQAFEHEYIYIYICKVYIYFSLTIKELDSEILSNQHSYSKSTVLLPQASQAVTANTVTT